MQAFVYFSIFASFVFALCLWFLQRGNPTSRLKLGFAARFALFPIKLVAIFVAHNAILMLVILILDTMCQRRAVWGKTITSCGVLTSINLSGLGIFKNQTAVLS